MFDRLKGNTTSDTGVGKAPSLPASVLEFPPLTEKDLKEIVRLFGKLFNKFDKKLIRGLGVYTGINENIGEGGEIYNSVSTLRQLFFVLAMSRHPLVRQMLEDEFDESKFNAKIFIENKILAGMRILDLGSGPFPVLARCCRVMGADVWTVDKKPKFRHLDFKHNREFLPKEQCDLEDQRHIELDLNDSNAASIIQGKTTGNFDLVTEANLLSNWGLSVTSEYIAMFLLKKGGVHYKNMNTQLKE